MSVENLRYTVVPKSDQLNADDLIAGPMTIKITGVKRGDSEQPVIVTYEGGEKRPYKPCKSMRRVMIHAWGDNGSDWVGHSVTLYTDPEVKFGGVKVGGIRISHLTGISTDMDIALTATRGKRSKYVVKALRVAEPVAQQEFYPDEKFNQELPRMVAALDEGRTTREAIIAHCEKTAPLSQQQKDKIVPTKSQHGDDETY